MSPLIDNVNVKLLVFEPKLQKKYSLNQIFDGLWPEIIILFTQSEEKRERERKKETKRDKDKEIYRER
jgi:hypothetical protein